MSNTRLGPIHDHPNDPLTSQAHSTVDTHPSSQSTLSSTSNSVHPVTNTTTTTTKSMTNSPPKRNAFTALMSPQPKRQKTSSSHTTPIFTPTYPPTHFSRALEPYLINPELYPKDILHIFPTTILLRDKFPKATVHFLLVPRDPAYNVLPPHEAFSCKTEEGRRFLEMVRGEVSVAVEIVGKELGTKLGKAGEKGSHKPTTSNTTDTTTVTSLPAATSGSSLPEPDLKFKSTRRSASISPPPLSRPPAPALPQSSSSAPSPSTNDYSSHLKIGVHALPSLSTLHIHILSRDLISPCLKHKKHYNSFTTPFFIPLDAFPLADNDPRISHGGKGGKEYAEGLLKGDMTCWRCGKGFGNRFKELKAHLDVEFELWKGELGL